LKADHPPRRHRRGVLLSVRRDQNEKSFLADIIGDYVDPVRDLLPVFPCYVINGNSLYDRDVERRIVSGTGDELFSGDYCYKTTHFWRNDMKHTA